MIYWVHYLQNKTSLCLRVITFFLQVAQCCKTLRMLSGDGEQGKDVSKQETNWVIFNVPNQHMYSVIEFLLTDC